MTEFETASLILRGLVGTGQIGVVAIGILERRELYAVKLCPHESLKSLPTLALHSSS